MYADPATAQVVEEYSVSLAERLMWRRFGEPVQVMPRNNPGFDLRVGSRLRPTRFVEVKGTQTAEPVFFMSDGERRFSIANTTRYTLIVVSGINVRRGTHGLVTERDGALIGPDLDLRTSQWRGKVLRAGPSLPT